MTDLSPHPVLGYHMNMVTRILCGIAALTLPTTAFAQATPEQLATAREAALTDTSAYAFIEGLTTEVGQRQGGTEAEARARTWAVARLRAMGFANARIEEFQMPTWVRGAERAEILAPFPQALTLTALGNSGATPPDGLTAEVVGFANLADFEAADPALVQGRIIYIGHAMRRTQDGSSYGAFGPVRFVGPDRAARRGAAAIVIRSVGTDRDRRNPHTGNTNFGAGVVPIPAAALSNPDADNLERILARSDTPVRMRLVLTPRNIGQQTSGNVIADIPGSEPAAGMVTIACHLDSWDLGTGAIDDAAGCGIIAAAGQRVGAMPGQRRRTIRILMAGAEEVGVWGGRDYGQRHARDGAGASRHAVALESDFGAGRVWRVDFRLPAIAAPLADRIAAALNPLGIARGRDPASGGADIGTLAQAGVPLIDLQQDGTRYFDLHHTADDTLAAIDIAEVQQNVAAWTVTLALLADAPEALGPTPAGQTAP
jgi:Zn-dependent M28 family amino/carboxypeptidase